MGIGGGGENAGEGPPTFSAGLRPCSTNDTSTPHGSHSSSNIPSSSPDHQMRKCLTAPAASALAFGIGGRCFATVTRHFSAIPFAARRSQLAAWPILNGRPPQRSSEQIGCGHEWLATLQQTHGEPLQPSHASFPEISSSPRSASPIHPPPPNHGSCAARPLRTTIYIHHSLRI